jgi:4-nitrophenyl phosphatase
MVGQRTDAAPVTGARTTTNSPGEHDAWERFLNARGFVFDMDGVLYRGETRLPGVSEVLDALTVRGREYMLATNNSMATPDSYVAKLARMGIDVPADRILTSALATRDYLLETLPADAGLFVIGMPALREQLFSGTSFRPIQFGEEQPAAVVIGLDLAFTYDKLKDANAAIRSGALFIATNSDATLPTEAGLVPGAGSIVASITTATGQTPLVIGKPETPLLVQSLHRLDVPAGESVMIGDRLDTDILAGQRAGMLTVMVLTGVSTREEILHAAVRPDIVVNDLLDLVAAFSSDRPAR